MHGFAHPIMTTPALIPVVQSPWSGRRNRPYIHVSRSTAERLGLGLSRRIHATCRTAEPARRRRSAHGQPRYRSTATGPIDVNPLSDCSRISRLSFSRPRQPMTSLCKITQVRQKGLRQLGTSMKEQRNSLSGRPDILLMLQDGLPDNIRANICSFGHQGKLNEQGWPLGAWQLLGGIAMNCLGSGSKRLRKESPLAPTKTGLTGA